MLQCLSPPRPVSMFTSLVVSSLLSSLCLLPPPTAAQYASCPEPYGLQVYPHDSYCDKFYKCANGKLGQAEFHELTGRSGLFMRE